MRWCRGSWEGGSRFRADASQGRSATGPRHRQVIRRPAGQLESQTLRTLTELAPGRATVRSESSLQNARRSTFCGGGDLAGVHGGSTIGCGSLSRRAASSPMSANSAFTVTTCGIWPAESANRFLRGPVDRRAVWSKSRYLGGLFYCRCLFRSPRNHWPSFTARYAITPNHAKASTSGTPIAIR